jgi:hypothetical protein
VLCSLPVFQPKFCTIFIFLVILLDLIVLIAEIFNRPINYLRYNVVFVFENSEEQ